MDIILIIHVLAVVFWIGGVGFATMVIFPTIRGIEDGMEKVRLFIGVEKRFSKLAKVYVVIAGVTGFLLFLRMGGLTWAFANPVPHLMLAFKVLVWLAFVILLFGAEKHMMKMLVSGETTPEKAFKRMSIFHWIMLTLSGIAIVFGVML